MILFEKDKEHSEKNKIFSLHNISDEKSFNKEYKRINKKDLKNIKIDYFYLTNEQQ